MKAALPTPAIDLILRGEPERLVQAAKQPRILVVWQHTNEELAPLLMDRLLRERQDLLEHVDYICGNPKAAAIDRQKGFLETDLNRSYLPPNGPQSYEDHRAEEIMRLIATGGYDYILDPHTSVTDVGNFIIISNKYLEDPDVRAMIAAAPLRRIIVMPDDIARHTLIGAAHPAIVTEYNERLAETRGVDDLLALLDGLVTGTPLREPFEREFFFVDGTVPKTEDPGPDVQNFKMCSGGYYPIFLGTGPRSYREDKTKNYVCFRATTRTTAVL
jgi:succinylglutamate desuccinylase